MQLCYKTKLGNRVYPIGTGVDEIIGVKKGS